MRHPAWFQLTYWLLMGGVPLVGSAILAGAMFLLSRSERQQLARERSLLRGTCPTCGYDLRATPNQCPECGTAM